MSLPSLQYLRFLCLPQQVILDLLPVILLFTNVSLNYFVIDSAKFCYIISENQGAFVSRRSILHNVIIFKDLIKMYNEGQAPPSCLMKLDIKKAYDIVKQVFIEEITTELGFPSNFTQLIMTCMSTTRFSILLNCNPIDLLQPKRWLRQGDPLTPFLFTQSMEYDRCWDVPQFKYIPDSDT